MSPAERFKQLVNSSEDFDLAEAALLIAAEEYPDLSVGEYIARLDRLADEFRRSVPDGIKGPERIVSLSRFLFEEQGFSGNAAHYYDPRNSFLNEVLDRRLGIPITLSIVYMEVGRRVGLALDGVSFPGHFLVKCTLPEGTVVLDPYQGGVSLGFSDLEERLKRFDREATTVVAALTAATKKEILVRMLRNLKGIYLHYRQFNAALSAIDRILAIMPELAAEIRDRGFVYENLECFRAALEDFRRYLETEPGADDADAVRDRIIALATMARLN